MVVIFGTVGSNPKVLIPTLRVREDIEKVVYYFAKDDEREKVSEKTAKVLQEYCERRMIKYEAKALDSSVDLLKIAKKIRTDLSQYKSRDSDIVFNVTGGTKVMASAALLACILEGIHAVYVNEDTKDEVELPLILYEYKSNLSNAQRKILEAVHRLGNNCNLTEISNDTKLKKSTLSYHIAGLKRMGLISIEESADLREKRIKILPAVEIMLD